MTAVFNVDTPTGTRLLTLNVNNHDEALAALSRLREHAKNGVRRFGTNFLQYPEVTLLGVFTRVTEATNVEEALELI